MTTEQVFICDCGHPESEHSEITRGYCTLVNGKTLCYDCCEQMDKQQIAMSKRGDKFTAYVSGDGKSITNWPGRVLGKVLYLKRLASTNKHGERYYSLHAEMFDGSVWTSRCLGHGMYCLLTKK